MEVVWCWLAAGLLTWGILVEGLPPLEWVNAGTVAAFGLAFSWAWVRAPERESGSEIYVPEIADS